MIERLNFYDIYGYLLPGLVWLGLMWLPAGIIMRQWPSAEFSSAVAALVVGYVAGHLLQGVALGALPSKRYDNKRVLRDPSDILLDDPDTLSSGDIDRRLAPETKHRVLRKIGSEFGMDVSGRELRNTQGLSGEETIRLLRKRRQDAFLLCRRILVQKGAASYAEQFEGMYALMRGVAAASFLAGAFYFGWAAALVLPDVVGEHLGYLLLLGLGLLLLASRDRRAFWVLAFFLAVLGSYVGAAYFVNKQEAFLLLAMSALALFGFFRFLAAYVAFAWNFAGTVYRDFSVLPDRAPVNSNA